MTRFENENTYEQMLQAGRSLEFHSKYETALAEAEEQFLGEHQFHHIINGKEVEAKSYFDNHSPISDDLIVGSFARGSAEDVGAAMKAAKEAFRTWSHVDLEDRVMMFRKAAEIMSRDKFLLAAAITLDNGKNSDEAVAEVDEAIDFIRMYAFQMKRYEGFVESLKPPYDDEESISVMRPYGVWAVVCPFNFPLAISAGMLTGAIITGNTVVVKPASPAPLSPFLIEKAYRDAGLPPGVINIVTGSGAEVGDSLVRHEDVSGIVFTGSRDVGFHLMRNSVRRWPIPVIAEMGGKNAAIVAPSADLDKAAEGVFRSAFSYSGQKCSACSRVYVHESVYDQFVEKMKRFANAARVMDPRKREAFTGPVIHQKAVDEYRKYLDLGKRDGKVLAGGEAGGNYMRPAMLADLPRDHFLVRNELFLPILCIQRCKDLEEAFAAANSVDYGLTSGFYSREKKEIDQYFDSAEAGLCYVNRTRGATTGAMVGGQAFGGWKASTSTGKGTGTAHYLLQFLRQQSRTMAR
jgi:1-pyrroline-5-carboxylate dehydrogenase